MSYVLRISQKDLVRITDEDLVLRSWRLRSFHAWKHNAAKIDYRLALDAEMLRRGLLTLEKQ